MKKLLRKWLGAPEIPKPINMGLSLVTYGCDCGGTLEDGLPPYKDGCRCAVLGMCRRVCIDVPREEAEPTGSKEGAMSLTKEDLERITAEAREVGGIVFAGEIGELVDNYRPHHSIETEKLRRQVDGLQLELASVKDQSFIHYLFFVDLHPELVAELVELAYKKEPESARDLVADFHDQTLDLSTLECTGKDFTPWFLKPEPPNRDEGICP